MISPENLCEDCPTRKYINKTYIADINPRVRNRAKFIANYILEEAQCEGPNTPDPSEVNPLQPSVCNNVNLNNVLELLRTIDQLTAQ